MSLPFKYSVIRIRRGFDFPTIKAGQGGQNPAISKFGSVFLQDFLTVTPIHFKMRCLSTCLRKQNIIFNVKQTHSLTPFSLMLCNNNYNENKPPSLSSSLTLTSLRTFYSNSPRTISKSNLLCYKFKCKISNLPRIISRHYSQTYKTFEDQPPSWLFVSNAVAGAYGAQVNLDLDLDQILLSEEGVLEMRENLRKRNQEFDLDSLVSDYKRLIGLKTTQQDLVAQREKIAGKLKAVRSSSSSANSDGNVETTEDIKRQLTDCKTRLKELVNDLWSLEDEVMRSALRLPNLLHSDTPLSENRLIKESCPTSQSNDSDGLALSHVEIGKKFGLIKFSNVGPQAYYLKGSLARASLRLSDIASQYFHSNNYRLMSGPEFYKTPILEGCGQDVFDLDKVLTIQHSSQEVEPMMHLAGVSLMTFAAYVAKLCVGDSTLPLNMFSVGNHYRQPETKDTGSGLYGATQTSRVGIFSAVSENELDQQYKQTVDLVWEFISAFGFTLRMSECSAPALKREERRRTNIDVWAPSLDKFVLVAHIADHGDFVSRRLMCLHNHNHADIRHTQRLHMVSGVAADLTTLLTVWMEHSQTQTDSFTLCEIPLPSVETTQQQ